MEAIPVNTPLLNGNELKYVSECIQTGWISGEGPFINKFEQEFARYVNRDFGIAVSSGSAALDIAIKALGIGPGDEVIMPAFTIISPAQSIINQGALPVLIDSDPETWNINVAEIEAKITSRTKAVLIVHTYGLPVDMDEVLSLAHQYNLKVIEDAAEVHGQTYRGKKCGSFGDISIFSFYANKIITTGEGGMVLTNQPELAEKCKKLRNLAFEPNKKRFVHEEIGWNYRMTNMQAAIGLAQLENIDSLIKRKFEIGKLYQENLNFLLEKGFQLPLESTSFAENIYWVFGIVAPSQELYTEIITFLNKLQIGTRPFFWGMHQQPVFQSMGLFLEESHPVTEKLGSCGFYLPSGLGLTNENIIYITRKINDYFV